MTHWLKHPLIPPLTKEPTGTDKKDLVYTPSEKEISQYGGPRPRKLVRLEPTSAFLQEFLPHPKKAAETVIDLAKDPKQDSTAVVIVTSLLQNTPNANGDQFDYGPRAQDFGPNPCAEVALDKLSWQYPIAEPNPPIGWHAHEYIGGFSSLRTIFPKRLLVPDEPEQPKPPPLAGWDDWPLGEPPRE